MSADVTHHSRAFDRPVEAYVVRNGFGRHSITVVLDLNERPEVIDGDLHGMSVDEAKTLRRLLDLAIRDAEEATL